MPGLIRSVGFDADGGKVRVGAGTTVYGGPKPESGWPGAPPAS